MKENETLLKDYEITMMARKNDNGNDYFNLYLYVDGKRFELVPHCRTVRETAYFYALLTRTASHELPNKESDQKK